MIATLILSNGAEIEVYNNSPRLTQTRTFKVVLDDKFALDLRGVNGPVRWGTLDNDEVLSIDDNGGPTATITATAIGTSTMTIRARGEEWQLPVEVTKSPRTTQVDFSFGNVRDRQQ